MVYTVDEHELRLYTSGAALRFPLGPQARQLLWKGKPVTDLRPGERVRLDVHMAADGQAMQVDAFEVLAGAPRSQHNPHEAHAASPLSPTPQATEEPATTKKGDQP